MKPLYIALCLLLTSLGSVAYSAEINLNDQTDYMVFSEGVYDKKTGARLAGQCNKNPKAAELMAVSKLSKFISGSTITSYETTSPSAYKMATKVETSSLRPDYMIVANHNFDGYHCYLVSTKN